MPFINTAVCNIAFNGTEELFCNLFKKLYQEKQDRHLISV